MKLIEWIYPIAIRATYVYDGLTDEERQDAFTKRIKLFYNALDQAGSPGEFVEYVKRGTLWGVQDILRAKALRASREKSIEASREEADALERGNEVTGAELKQAFAALNRGQSEQDIRELRGLVRARLKPRQREVFDLIESGEWTVSEMCEKLRITRVNFDVIKFRLKAEIQQIVKELYATDQ